MAGLFGVSEATSLGLHATALMANDEKSLHKTVVIAESLGVSKAHLMKVMQRLAEKGILFAKRGREGGFRLARPAASITLKDVYEAISTRILADGCPLKIPICQGEEQCVLGHEFLKKQSELADFLTRTTLADLVR